MTFASILFFLRHLSSSNCGHITNKPNCRRRRLGISFVPGLGRSRPLHKVEKGWWWVNRQSRDYQRIVANPGSDERGRRNVCVYRTKQERSQASNKHCKCQKWVMTTKKSRAWEKDPCTIKGTLSRRFCCNFDQNILKNLMLLFVHKMLQQYQNENVYRIVTGREGCN